MQAPPRPGSLAPPRRQLTAAEAGAVLGVRQSIVNRWARQGKLPCADTPLGRRFDEAEMWAIRAAQTTVRQP